MAIGLAVEKGNTIYIYNERGSETGSTTARDGLYGYSSVAVAVRSGSTIYLYNEHGANTGSVNV